MNGDAVSGLVVMREKAGWRLWQVWLEKVCNSRDEAEELISDEAGASSTRLWCEPLVGGAMDQPASLERSAGTGAQAARPARWRGGQAQHQTGAAYPCIDGSKMPEQLKLPFY
jgi:hypothetical protein